MAMAQEQTGIGIRRHFTREGEHPYDGVAWERRDDEAGIDVSADGWDSEMIHCGWVQPTASGTYLFYNGNGYGETGFGVALLRSSS